MSLAIMPKKTKKGGSDTADKFSKASHVEMKCQFSLSPLVMFKSSVEDMIGFAEVPQFQRMDIFLDKF